MNFLPEDYKAPQSNNAYFKLQDGENRVRIISSPIIGWEDWKDKKPIRFRYNAKPLAPIDPTKPIRHFWAFLIWSYENQKIMIWEITQGTIRKAIESLSKDKDWGAPYNYDIKIVKTGKNKETDYSVNPCPAKEIDILIKESFYDKPIDLEELFKGGDPFTATDEYRTKAFWEMEAKPKEEVKVDEEALISDAQVNKIEMDIHNFIRLADPNWRASALSALKIPSFKQLKAKLYPMMIERIEAKRAKIIESEEIPF